MLAKQHKSWSGNSPPKKILIIRFHALGDIAIALSFLESISELTDSPIIDFIIHENYAEFLKPIRKIRKVYLIKENRIRFQLIYSLYLLPILRRHKYDIVLDLQGNIVSRNIRRYLSPKGWTTFDRFSSKTAFERYQNSIGACLNHKPNHQIPALRTEKSDEFSQEKKLVLLNPAGAWTTRNWSMQSYIDLADLWLSHDSNIRFLLIGLDTLSEKVLSLIDSLGDNCENRIGKTKLSELLPILSNIHCTVSEDSGLLHISALLKRPTVALLGSSRSDWTSPVGEHTYTFNSDDLECGNCMSEVCLRGDNYCLTRVKPHDVLAKCLELTNL